MKMTSIILLGSSGFIGKSLLPKLTMEGFSVKPMTFHNPINHVNEFLKSAITQSLEPAPIIKEKIKTPNQDIEKIQNLFKEIKNVSDDAKKDMVIITKKIKEMSQMNNKEPKKMKCVTASDLDLHLDKLESINHSCLYG